MARDIFDDDFFRRMFKQFFKDFERDLKPFEKMMRVPSGFEIRKPGGFEKRGGLSFFISSNGKNPPKVEIRRFGPGGKWEKLPVERKGGASAAELPEKSAKISRVFEKLAPQKVKERAIPEYGVTIDPREITVTMNAEGVGSEENVNVKFYPGSAELFAIAPGIGKEYFCTVALPTNVDRQGTTIDVEKKKVTVRIPRNVPTLR